MARVGRDVKLPSPVRDQLDAPLAMASATGQSHLQAAAAAGLDGVLFRTLFELTPTLDPQVLTDIRACADDLDLYLEVGVGKVNPYMTAELPEIRDLGDGDYLAGMRRMIEAAHAVGCTELWTATAFQKPQYGGLFALDRYRTDVTWPEQLRATAAFLRLLAPLLRDLGVRLNLETHEEITTFELVRLIEEVGADVLGITFDSANVLAQGELPLAAARRVAPYVRQTHLRDVALFDHGPDLIRYLAPCGAGVTDWADLLGILLAANPGLNLSIEGSGPHRGGLVVPLSEPRWHESHADLTATELDAAVALTRQYAELTAIGAAPDRVSFENGVLGGIDEFVLASAAHLRSVLAAAG